ncbi:hypothetical protein N0V90_006963 [Kalmusia sp. IMI 367209]|nr:hypothetical protein N0V90_006963 [Kalmusia sp. IMI 367209]
MHKLEAAVKTLADQVSAPMVLQALRDEEPSTHDHVPQGQDRQELGEEHSSQWEIVVDGDAGPEAPPGSYLSRPATSTTPRHRDMITRGIISYEKAQSCLNLYQKRLDHFPYRILADQAAICAVSSLHMATSDFDACYEEFFSTHSKRNFARDTTLDDVRAVCIGAFWLSDISWSLIGTAVRIATELQLQKSFVKALEGDRQHYLRTRLYLLVYACDHHFSIPFGRPPMTRECGTIRNVRKFLDCEHATEDDARLVSQVLRWSLCTNVFDTYDIDIDRPLTAPHIAQLRTFCMSLDSLRAEWGARFTPNVHVGNYPRKGVGLQCDFAKLYLCSHAFRGTGVAHSTNRSQEAALVIDNIAHEGIISALSIIRIVTTDKEVQTFFDGLPTYFDIMLAFSVVFLFKISTRYGALFRIDGEATKRSVHELVHVLKRITAGMHPRHLLVSLTEGIDELLQRWDLGGQIGSRVEVPVLRQESQGTGEEMGDGLDWFDGIIDPVFMGEYDLLMGQDVDFPFEN